MSALSGTKLKRSLVQASLDYQKSLNDAGPGPLDIDTKHPVQELTTGVGRYRTSQTFNAQFFSHS